MKVTEKKLARSIWEKLELGLGSGANFRILLHMIMHHNNSFTKYALVKATGIRTPSVNKQLKVLCELEWVKEYKFTPVTYQINMENNVVRHIHNLLINVKSINQLNEV
jgi:hypothetical protein